MSDKQGSRNIYDKIVKGVQRFMAQEKSGGIVLAVAVLLAILLANSALSDRYYDFFQQKLGFIWNGEPYLYFSLHHWINDGLMSIFFFHIGLELKRELISGELSDPRNIILPIGAAIGGMAVPALVYLFFNAGTPEYTGWGVPMTTDIAFALGVLFLLGKHVPTSIKVFLTTLAIVDDLGAVIVIALFYTSEISVANLALGLGFLLLMFIGNKLGVKNVFFYAFLGIVGVWIAFLLSGIHATIAAVLAALTIPADSTIDESTYLYRMRKLGLRFMTANTNEYRTLENEQVKILATIREDAKIAIPPLQLIEHHLNPFVTFLVLPIFAISNAGISLVGIDWSAIFATNVAIGIALGLLLGKPLGVVGITWLLDKLNIAKRPHDMSMRHLFALGFLASIGFTMSMFISTLAFRTDLLLTQAKIGIFAASIVGGCLGYLLMKPSRQGK